MARYETADKTDYILLKEFGRENRKRMTQEESIMWDCLCANRLGVWFRRQHIIGGYIVDFVCLSKSLVIEIDGKYHLEENIVQYDLMREDYLKTQGYDVLRFTNEEIIGNIESVISTIRTKLNTIQ